MFGSVIKTPKVTNVTNSVSPSGAPVESKTHSQKKGTNKDRKIQARMKLIEQQKMEIENLKATQATGVSPKQLVNAMLQAMACLNVDNKKTPASIQVIVTRNL